MADFNECLHNLKPPFSEIMTSSNMELLNNLITYETFNSNIQGLADFSSGSFLDHQQPRPSVLPFATDHHNIQSCVQFSDGPFSDPVAHFLPSADDQGPSHSHRDRNSLKGISETETLLSDNSKNKRNPCLGGKKRKRSNDDRETEKPREVIHVRAKRGQATDSHSLAERLRREKINEKLRSLQDLVPGCYKTMGMAVMLDVIINYVRSLQNQIDFLSMKLSAASLFYDFNSEMDTGETMQGTNGYEAQGMERMGGEGYGGGGGGGGEGGGISYFPSTWPSLT